MQQNTLPALYYRLMEGTALGSKFNEMKRSLITLCCLFLVFAATSQQITGEKLAANTFALGNSVICVDTNDPSLVQLAAQFLQKDIEVITGTKPVLQTSLPKKATTVIIIGSVEKSSLIKELVKKNKIKTISLSDKWEAYSIQTISNPFSGIANAIIITGSDRRGIAYGVFELSKQIGVSPWYWWADVPVKTKSTIYIKKNTSITDLPKVKYRGIFINDEAPALSNWSKSTFGGFNHKFYEKVFELILRLKGNYIWPAMWGNAFYDDDSINIKTADEYGIVIGTSHHEPLMRAHDEWRRYGNKQKWNYDSTEKALKEFWKNGMKRAWNEKIVSVGMRGDGDEPMSRETATALLEKIVKDQRDIIANVTGKPASQTPQLWALYKEVQDYYDKGMRVPDDVTLLLCDDNWGNLRKLPKLTDATRKGGYGIYYHFDYVGGPRNYKWLNTNPLPRIWEQMHLAWEYKVRQIWIVNVGDIKPMEFPVSFFLDYAWNPERIDADGLQSYSQQWAADNFGKMYAKEIAAQLAEYAKYNGRRKPELLDANTYSFNYNEWNNVVTDYNKLLARAEKVNNQLPVQYRDAFYQLVLHPIKACANLNEMYYNVALNKEAYKNKWAAANLYADKVKQLYTNDSLLTLAYHQLKNGKWNHMMSQTHIGYTYWQQPAKQKIPAINYVPLDSIVTEADTASIWREAIYPKHPAKKIFYERNGYLSIEATHFTKAITTTDVDWKILPDHGRTGSAITSFPVTASLQKPGGASPHLQYEIYTYSKDSVRVYCYFSPTLNFHNAEQGLQYAVSIDDEAPQIFSINKEDKNSINGIWNKWVAESIILKSSNHKIQKAGKHTVKYWVVDPGVVLQKIVLDFGGVKQSFLGPPETLYQQKK
jgi:Glycosyl hydrolase family 115/Gylcosyl hydrolase family 115 C-terminal domain/Glycosyl hydrolase family 67 N-terminus